MSRRAADCEIARGNVTVNGETAVTGQKTVPGQDEIRIGGVLVGSPGKHVYIMLNKPVGYVTTLDDEMGRRCVAELVSDVGERVYPVGRLDRDSEGLLIMTNDGEFANRMMHPRYGKSKLYHVRIAGEVTQDQISELCEPFEIDGYITHGAEVSAVQSDGGGTLLSVRLHEGRNRQIRRMCEALGLRVLSLKRVAYGELTLGNLQPGKWRYLTESQIASLCGGDGGKK